MHAVGQNTKPDGCALNLSHLNETALLFKGHFKIAYVYLDLVKI